MRTIRLEILKAPTSKMFFYLISIHIHAIVYLLHTSNQKNDYLYMMKRLHEDDIHFMLPTYIKSNVNTRFIHRCNNIIAMISCNYHVLNDIMNILDV